MEKAEVKQIMKVIPYLVGLSVPHLWLDYDQEADVLYLSFSREPADDTEISEDNILFRYKGDSLIGITIPNASKRIKEIH